MPARLTTKEFVARARRVHGDRYDYERVHYVNSYTDVTIVCPTHGPYRQNPASHLRGSGCRACAQSRARRG